MANLESTKLINLTKRKFRAPTRNKHGGKLGNNTYALYDPELASADIRLHGNLIAILSYDETGKHITITDAGWNTVTTRDRLNQILSDNNVIIDGQHVRAVSKGGEALLSYWVPNPKKPGTLMFGPNLWNMSFGARVAQLRFSDRTGEWSYAL